MYSFSDKYLSIRNEKEFLIEFLFQLTISYRSLRESDAYDLSQVNEINHRILNRVRDLENKEKWTSKESTLDSIHTHLRNAPSIVADVSFASERAFEKVRVIDDEMHKGT